MSFLNPLAVFGDAAGSIAVYVDAAGNGLYDG
jgi:hypothetical protein